MLQQGYILATDVAFFMQKKQYLCTVIRKRVAVYCFRIHRLIPLRGVPRNRESLCVRTCIEWPLAYKPTHKTFNIMTTNNSNNSNNLKRTAEKLEKAHPDSESIKHAFRIAFVG